MSRKFDKVYEAMRAELDGAEAPVETSTQTAQEEVQEVETPEDTVNDTTEDDTPAEREETPKDDVPLETPEDKPEETQKAPREIPDDPLKRAEFSFKRQLEKKDKKHEKELADRDAKYDELLKKFEALEKKMTPPEPEKTRDQFADDEEFMDYKVDRRFNQKMAEFEAKRQKKEAERAEQEKQQLAAQEELREKQENWISNVDQAFAGDAKRAKAFMSNVAYANKHGLGQILDSCPVAADYLINDPYGPLVFEKILNDRATFDRVFDPRRPNALAVYHELRAVEDEITREAKAPQQEAPKTVVPKMGRPGRQTSGMSVTNTDMFSDPKLVKQWLREQRGKRR